MFGIAPLRRNYEAALRDLRSQRPAVRASAAQDLAVAGEANPRAAADALAPLLGDDAAQVRSAALASLGALGARHLLEAIAARFEDADSTVRQVAVMTVAELGGERAIAVLRGALEHAHADVSFQALVGVTTLAPQEGVEAALRALERSDVWIASEAATQLGLLLAPSSAGDTVAVSDATRERARAALAARLGAPDPLVAVSCAMALGRLGDPLAAPVLARFVRDRAALPGDDGDELRAEAIELLGGFDTEASREALATVAWRVLPGPHRALARAVLARLGDLRAAGEIVAGLRSPWERTRNTAVRLATIGRVRSATGDLIALLESGRAEPLAVIQALGAVGDPRSRPALERLARTTDHAELRQAARRALALLDEAEPA